MIQRFVAGVTFFIWLSSINLLWTSQGYEEIEKEGKLDKYERNSLESVVKLRRINKQDFEMCRQIKPTNKFE